MMPPTTWKVVLAGCGGISRAWLDALKNLPHIKIVGLVDIHPEAAQKRAQEYGLETALLSDDLAATLKRTSPDVVFDCAVPEAHYSVTLTALQHGCHVLGEKPLADTMAHAREMVDAAQKAGKIFAVIQNRRYDANIRRVRHLIETGSIGQITTLYSDFFIGAHFGGFRDRMRHVLLLDMAIHTFDAARFLAGADPLTAFCHEWNPAGSWYDHDASADAIFEMSGGIHYGYHGSWCAEGLNTSWNAAWRIIGTRGSILWDGEETIRVQRVKKTGGFFSEWEEVEPAPWNATEKTGGHAGQIRDFFECLENNRLPETICTDNIKSLAMVFSAIESAETGQRIEIRV